MISRESVFGSPLDPSSAPRAIPRRAWLGGMGGALAALLASPQRVVAADAEHGPNDPFVVLLHGIYQRVPVGGGPADNLGLTSVNLSDGSFSKTQIYPVWGVDGANDQKKAIGAFYPQATLENGTITFNGLMCAYDLPGGSIAMRFLLPGPPLAPAGFDGFVPFTDNNNGYFLEGTFELTIVEATGVYSSFKGGHNHMVDRLHQQADGHFNEFCFCNISSYEFP